MMDGLDSRGEVVVIGATNRLDNIDPALRRPGRFDREFIFPLPSKEARMQIIKIKTKEWRPKLPDWFIADLAERCEGYCGADLQALCTEAALLAFGRHFPQIYDAEGKLDINVAEINVTGTDFINALKKITPAQQRSGTTRARKVASYIAPLIAGPLKEVLIVVERLIPAAWASRRQVLPVEDKYAAATVVDIYRRGGGGGGSTAAAAATTAAAAAATESSLFGSNPYARPPPHFARLLVTGAVGSSQTTHLCPAILSELEKYPVHALDLPALLSDSTCRSLEEACVKTFREAQRASPSVLFLPRVDAWWGVVGESVQTTIALLLGDMVPDCELFVLASSDEPWEDLPPTLQVLFESQAQCYNVPLPAEAERRSFFDAIFENAKLPPPVVVAPTSGASGMRTRAKRKRAELKLLPAVGLARELSGAELGALEQEEEAILRQLRMYFRTVLNDLISDKKFKVFRELPDAEEIPDYFDVVSKPECLSSMLSKLNDGVYDSTDKFLGGIDQIRANAYAYNSDEGIGRKIRSSASDLKDSATHLVEEARHEHAALLKECTEIAASRKRRRIAAAAAKAAAAGSGDENDDEDDPLLVSGNTPQKSSTSSYSSSTFSPNPPTPSSSPAGAGAEAGGRTGAGAGAGAEPGSAAGAVGMDDGEGAAAVVNSSRSSRSNGKGRASRSNAAGAAASDDDDDDDDDDAAAEMVVDEAAAPVDGAAAASPAPFSGGGAAAAAAAFGTPAPSAALAGGAAAPPLESPGEFECDEEKLETVLEAAVAGSAGTTVADLDSLSSKLRHAIFNHRHNYDNSILESVLEAIVADFCEGRSAEAE